MSEANKELVRRHFEEIFALQAARLYLMRCEETAICSAGFCSVYGRWRAD